MESKFIKPENHYLVNEIDYINFHYAFDDIFKDDPRFHIKSSTEACFIGEGTLNDTMFILNDKGTVTVKKENKFDISVGAIISKFMLLTAVKFKGDSKAAQSWVTYNILKKDIPFIRVGTDFYKVIDKENRYGGTDKALKAWDQKTITGIHGKNLIKLIPNFDDFCIVPDNKNHSTVHKNCYNLYAPFPHKPSHEIITEKDIPHSITVLNHIFGEQLELGLKYMKVLYEHPKQMLPVFVMVSEERGTGKTTFLNWLQMIFSENLVNIDPGNLASQFNYIYATKNIIMIDETIVEKTAAEQKVKSITTAKTMSVNPKHVQGYSIPFFGKIIMCTNKVRDFMRIDSEENRFWIRYIHPVKGKKHIKIEDDLFYEIPKLLKYITQLPPIDFSQDRLVFTLQETQTAELLEVKSESKFGLHKELEILIDNHFANDNSIDYFYASSIDIKAKWFLNDARTPRSYILKVLKNEMKINAATKPMRYCPFEINELGKDVVGRPFMFIRNTERCPKLADPQTEL